MKKLFTTLMIVFAVYTKAQITQETTYANAGNFGGNNQGNLSSEYLSAAGYKYSVRTSSAITLYNLNHSVYTTIATPTVSALACPQCPLNIWYMSDALFDTNPNTIEYMWVYELQSTPNVSYLRVYNQSGSILLAEDSVVPRFPGDGYAGRDAFLNYTPAGVKMIVYKSNGAAKVFSLPGSLPCYQCSGGVISGMATQGGNTPSQQLSNFPNPASDQTTIEYHLPKGINTGEIIIYDEKALEIKRYQVTSDFSNLLLSVTDLPSGIYYYVLKTPDGTSTCKKMVVMK